MNTLVQKKRVILADDDADDRMLFENAYEQRSDIILLPSAITGAEIIDMLHLTADHVLPDLIVLDQNMPMMNGKQTLSFLKSHPRYAHIHVCVYSTYADDRLIKDCKVLGAFRVLNKPLREEEYQTMMDEFLLAFH